MGSADTLPGGKKKQSSSCFIARYRAALTSGEMENKPPQIFSSHTERENSFSETFTYQMHSDTCPRVHTDVSLCLYLCNLPMHEPKSQNRRASTRLAYTRALTRAARRVRGARPRTQPPNPPATLRPPDCRGGAAGGHRSHACPQARAHPWGRVRVRVHARVRAPCVPAHGWVRDPTSWVRDPTRAHTRAPPTRL